MNFEVLDIINSISVFQLIFFTFFLIHKGRKNSSNIILAVFFAVQFIVLGSNVSYRFFIGTRYQYGNTFIFIVPFWFLFGPLMNIYIRSLVKKDFKFRITEAVHFIPFLIAVIYFTVQYVTINTKTGQIHEHIWRRVFRDMMLCGSLQNLQVLIYNIFSLIILFRYQKGLKDYCSSLDKRNLVWLKIVLYGYLVPCILAETNSFAGDLIPIPVNVKIIVIYSSFLTFFNILYYKAMLHPYVIIRSDEKPKYYSSNLDNDDIINYSKRIEDFVLTNKPYLNPNLTISELSESTGISEKHISQVINQCWKQNFYTYINLLRVEEAKRLLKTKETEKNTMYAIASDSGFNSKTVFYDAFKKYVGMTPTDFRKQYS